MCFMQQGIKFTEVWLRMWFFTSILIWCQLHQKFTLQSSTMSLPFKSYSLVEVIYWLDSIKLSFFGQTQRIMIEIVWINRTHMCAVNTQRKSERLRMKIKFESVSMKISDVLVLTSTTTTISFVRPSRFMHKVGNPPFWVNFEKYEVEWFFLSPE